MSCSTIARSIVVGALGVTGSAWANDSTFGGAGADLVPLEETRVQMVSEDILIEYRGRWQVTARYVFKNLSEKTVRLQVGFPEYRCENENEDCMNAPFEGLRTEVDGKAVAHRQGTLSKKHAWAPYLGVVWLYDVTFPAGAAVKVLHTYSLLSGDNVQYDRFTTYVTRTGALWAGAIDNARFTYRLPATAHTVIVPKGIPLVELRLVDPEGSAPYVEVRCEQTNWNPTEDLWLMFNDHAEYAVARLGSDALTRSGLRADDLCPPLFEREHLTASQRQMCVNEDYAIAGYPFKNKKLHSYYYGNPFTWRKEPTPWDPKQSWYARSLRPFPNLQSWQQTNKTPPDALSANPLPATDAPSHPSPTPSAAPGPATSSQSSVSPAPPPVQPRPGGCGCESAGNHNASPALLLLFAALGLRRHRCRSWVAQKL